MSKERLPLTPRSEAILTAVTLYLDKVEHLGGDIGNVNAEALARFVEEVLTPSETRESFPKVEVGEFATLYVTFREIKDGDVAKVVQRTVPASCDYDAAGNLIGVEIFDVLPESEGPEQHERLACEDEDAAKGRKRGGL